MTGNHRTRARLGIALTAAVGLGVLGFAGTAEANDRHVDPHYYSDYDRNHDGVLDHLERDAMHYDRDGDGRLDRHEREKLDHHFRHTAEEDRYRAPARFSFEDRRAGRLFVRLDRNRDGVLSPWEVSRRSRLARFFHRIDRSGDGVLSPWELDRYYDRSYRAPRYRPEPRSYRRSWSFRLF